MNAPRRGRLSLRVIASAAAATLGLLACIIPDTDIQVYSLDRNASAVRFVRGIPLSEAARCACDPNTCECPLPDQADLPTFLDPAVFPFCICGENRSDSKRLPGLTLFVEDQDVSNGEPADSLYAAALLDWDPTLGDAAFDYLAYRSFLDPRVELETYFSSYENQVLNRPRPFVRAIRLSDIDSRFDLCNGAGRILTPGYHTISFIATDRFWFKTDTDLAGTSESDSGGVEPSSVVLDGVPDVAAGATYDIESFVFYCAGEAECMTQCVDQ